MNLVIVQFLSGKMKKHQALRDPSPAFLSTLPCLYILNTLYMSLSQLGSTRELSTRENDLSSYFLILPIDSSGHKGLILLQNPSGEGLFHTVTGLNPFSSFLPLDFSKAVLSARNTFSPHLLAWITSAYP